MKKPIILFDIDYTLINTTVLTKEQKKEIYQLLLAGNKLSWLNFEKINKSHAGQLKRTSCFSPVSYLDFLGKELEVDKVRKSLEEVFFKKTKPYQRALYRETLKVIGFLNENYRLGIFSEGIREYQLAKVNFSGISKYLTANLIFIFAKKLTELEAIVDQLGEIIIVDDSPQIILGLEKIRGVSPIWIKRGPKAEGQELKVKTILSLNELIEKK